jgi:hypothetical protein
MFDRSQHPPAARADMLNAGGMTPARRAPGDEGRARIKASGAGSERGVSTVQAMSALLVVAVAFAILVPTFLRTAATSAGDVDARANLQVAMIAAKASYEVQQSYAYNGGPLSTLSFAAQAPEFTWITGSCAGNQADCVSEQGADVDAPGDGQGLVLAVWSSLTKTCWFGVDLETVPRPLPGDHSGLAFEPLALSGAGSGADNAGFYIAKSPPGIGSCEASEAISSGGLDWLQVGA